MANDTPTPTLPCPPARDRPLRYPRERHLSRLPIAPITSFTGNLTRLRGDHRFGEHSEIVRKHGFRRRQHPLILFQNFGTERAEDGTTATFAARGGLD